jgi:hypothetical protein
VPPRDDNEHERKQRRREDAAAVHAERERRHASRLPGKSSRVGNARVPKVELLRSRD